MLRLRDNYIQIRTSLILLSLHVRILWLHRTSVFESLLKIFDYEAKMCSETKIEN